MKKFPFTLTLVFMCACPLFAAGISFSGQFPALPGYTAALSEHPDSFDASSPSSILFAQTRYTSTSGVKWVLVTYSLGSTLEGRPSYPEGFSMDQNGVVIKVVRIQGLLALYTYYTVQNKGTINLYVPASDTQKYRGNITFLFTNVPRAEADAIIARFDLKAVQKRMGDLK